jgi:alginate O-acetyltransferase complex protein AlgJ
MDHYAHRRATLQTLLFAGIIAVLGALSLFRARHFHVPEHVGLVNGQLARGFEGHYDQVFPIRELGVNVWAAIDYLGLGEGRPGVVIGRQGWLFTDEEFNLGETFDANISARLALVRSVHHQFNQSGVALVVALVPSKARVYAQYLGGRQPAAGQRMLYDRLLAALAGDGITTADLRHTLAQGSAQQLTYFRTDTHWTPFGAQLAATAVVRVIRDAGLLGPGGPLFATHTGAPQLHRGDLVTFLPLQPYFASLLPQPEVISVDTTQAVAGERASQAATPGDLFGDAGLPGVVLVGTSYSANPLWNFPGYLREILGEDLADYSKEGLGPFRPMADYLRSADFTGHPPRLAIWEIPERAFAAAAAE